MTRYFIELAYDGTNYHGWQVQPNGITVQQVLEKAFSTLLKEEISVTGCGRTDTGVHAEYFVAHFDSEAKGLGKELVFKMNSFLPADIVIQSIREVGSEMHARFSAKYRKYRYCVSRVKPVFGRLYCLYYYKELDIELMNEACKILREYTDFTSFSKLHTDVRTNDCLIVDAHWTKREDGCDFEIKADRFLRNMVRSIVGTMLEVGTGKMTLENFRKVIESRDRGMAGMSVEARGLFLVEVGY